MTLNNLDIEYVRNLMLKMAKDKMLEKANTFVDAIKYESAIADMEASSNKARGYQDEPSTVDIGDALRVQESSGDDGKLSVQIVLDEKLSEHNNDILDFCVKNAQLRIKRRSD